MNKPFTYLLLVAGTLALLFLAPLDIRQITAVTVFLSIIYGTLLFWEFRLAFAFLGLAVLLATGLLDVAHVIQYAGLDIILFLIAMMILVGFLEENHFFEYLVEKIALAAKGNAYKLVGVLMAAAAVFASLVDEVTSILFMASTALHICRKAKIKPHNLIMMLVFATNIGSSATVVGNPIGVMIALRGGFTFMDFLRWAAPISLVALIITVLFSLIWFRDDIRALGLYLKKDGEALNDIDTEFGQQAQLRPSKLLLAWALFGSTIGCLVLHSYLEKLIGLQKNTLLLAIPFFASGLTLIFHNRDARRLVSQRVDWWTLSFFLILFSTVGTLKQLGVTTLLAQGFGSLTLTSPTLAFGLFNGLAALMTAFMDNVLAVATLIPVIEDLGRMGFHTEHLWWALLFSGTLFGNCTVIGSTANLVAAGMLEKEGQGVIPFWEWFKPGFIISTATLVVSLLLLRLQLG